MSFKTEEDYAIQAEQEVSFLDFVMLHHASQMRAQRQLKVEVIEINDKFFDYRKAILRSIHERTFERITGTHASLPLKNVRRRMSIKLPVRNDYETKVEMDHTIMMFILKFSSSAEARSGTLVASDFNDEDYDRYFLVLTQEIEFRSRFSAKVTRTADLNTLIYAPAGKSPWFKNLGLDNAYLLVVLVPPNVSNWRSSNSPDEMGNDENSQPGIVIKEELDDDDNSLLC